MTGDWKIEDGGQESEDFAVGYKFQNLNVYKLALDYLDKIYEIAERLPEFRDSIFRIN